MSAGDENAEALEESAQNMEDGFGHETEGCINLRERADQYREWGEGIEDLAIMELNEPDDSEWDDDMRDELASCVEAIDVAYQGE